ncbi:MAG: BNR-4 repeat-containing protein, partial [Armatimonadota bacterium]
EPEYICNTPSFDSHNRPYIRSRGLDLHETGHFETLRDGTWVTRSFVEAVKERYPDFQRFDRGAGWYYTHAVFDDQDNMYSIVQLKLENSKTAALLFSSDYGKTFQCYDLPGRSPNIELRTDTHSLPGPPLIATMEKVADHPTARWGAYNRLLLTQPVVTDEGLELPEPVAATEKCFGMCQHSGGASFATTIGTKTHITWAEMREEENLPGSPTFAATYDRETRTVGEPVFVGYAPPVNDVHNTPGICADSDGYVHVVTGAHGDHFYHYKSKQPNDLTERFEKAVTMLDFGFEHPRPEELEGPGRPARQTYLGLLCDPDDTLHAAFRWWIRSEDDPYHPGQTYASLGYQKKPQGEEWTDARKLVVAVAHGYSNYHAKLAMDRSGRLYISYSYFNKQPNWVYGENPSHYNFPAILTSGDGGETWELAETSHFEAGITE